MGEELPATDAVRHLVELAAPYADAIGLSPHLADVERMLRDGNGAQQQARAHLEGESLREVFAGTVAAAHRELGRPDRGYAGRTGMSDAHGQGRVVPDEERARALLEQLKSVHAVDIARDMVDRLGELRLPQARALGRDARGAGPGRRARLDRAHPRHPRGRSSASTAAERRRATCTTPWRRCSSPTPTPCSWRTPSARRHGSRRADEPAAPAPDDEPVAADAEAGGAGGRAGREASRAAKKPAAEEEAGGEEAGREEAGGEEAGREEEAGRRQLISLRSAS